QSGNLGNNRCRQRSGSQVGVRLPSACSAIPSQIYLQFFDQPHSAMRRTGWVAQDGNDTTGVLVGLRCIAMARVSPIDYGEGIVVWQAQHILDSSLTYRSISTPPSNVTHYPPVYHLVVCAAEKFTHNWLAAGRLVSLISGIGSVFVIGALVFAVLPRRVSPAD